MNEFWQKNKVLILGAVAAICTGLYGFIGQPITDWLVVGYAAFLALGSYAVKNARGQWVTIFGAILGAASVIYTGYSNHIPLNLGQLLLTVAVNIGLAATGPVKPVTYETSLEIVKAKETPPIEPVKEVTAGD